VSPSLGETHGNSELYSIARFDEKVSHIIAPATSSEHMIAAFLRPIMSQTLPIISLPGYPPAYQGQHGSGLHGGYAQINGVGDDMGCHCVDTYAESEVHQDEQPQVSGLKGLRQGYTGLELELAAARVKRRLFRSGCLSGGFSQ